MTWRPWSPFPLMSSRHLRSFDSVISNHTFSSSLPFSCLLEPQLSPQLLPELLTREILVSWSVVTTTFSPVCSREGSEEVPGRDLWDPVALSTFTLLHNHHHPPALPSSCRYENLYLFCLSNHPLVDTSVVFTY